VKLVKLLSRSARQPVTEHNAVEVIGLVLKATGQQSSTNDLDRITERVDSAAVRLIGPSQFNVGARQGQASLVGSLELSILALRQDDFGIADHAELPDLRFVCAVEDEHRQVQPDLGGG